MHMHTDTRGSTVWRWRPGFAQHYDNRGRRISGMVSTLDQGRAAQAWQLYDPISDLHLLLPCGDLRRCRTLLTCPALEARKWASIWTQPGGAMPIPLSSPAPPAPLSLPSPSLYSPSSLSLFSFSSLSPLPLSLSLSISSLYLSFSSPSPLSLSFSLPLRFLLFFHLFSLSSPSLSSPSSLFT
jgi:hypothetical protein